MTTILNLTQHLATAEQHAQGVVDLTTDQRAKLTALLTFDDLPSKEDLVERAGAIVSLIGWTTHDRAMIGGAPFFMGVLEDALRKFGITPVYAFSRRESEDRAQPDGSVRKVAVFRHIGFVEA